MTRNIVLGWKTTSMGIFFNEKIIVNQISFIWFLARIVGEKRKMDRMWRMDGILKRGRQERGRKTWLPLGELFSTH